MVKYGRTHYGKQRFRCQDCKRQFVEAPSRQPIDPATRDLVEKLLNEQLALAAIVRVTGVSERWLQMVCESKILCHAAGGECDCKKVGKGTFREIPLGCHHTGVEPGVSWITSG